MGLPICQRWLRRLRELVRPLRSSWLSVPLASGLLSELALLLIYASCLYFGLVAYARGIAFSFGGSSFGQQIACVAVSAGLLVIAAIVPTRSKLTCAMLRGGGRACFNRVPKRTHDEEEAQELLFGGAAAEEADASTGKYRGRDWCQLLRVCVLVPLPLVLPCAWSAYSFLHPDSHSTGLSAQINVILFSSIGTAIMLVFGIAYTTFALKRGRQVLGTLSGLLLIGGMLALATWSRAQTAYLRGIHTPAMLFDPQLRVNSGSDNLLELNPHIKRGLQNTMYSIGVSDKPRLSLLDSAEEILRRRTTSGCTIHPHAHLAEVLPRRAANFFTGLESCPHHLDFARFDWNAPEPQPSLGAAPTTTVPSQPMLTIDCPASIGALSFEASPDFIKTRSMGHSDVSRHYREIYLKDPAFHSVAEGAIAGLAHKEDEKQTPALSFSTGHHSFFRLQCGAHEQYFVTHAEKATVTQRAKKIMREQLFKEEYATETAFFAAPDVASSSTTPPSSSPPASPLLQNPPVLLLFIDCLSRSHFHRALPLTAAVLREAHHASRASRESREKVYVHQQRRRRVKQRRKRERGVEQLVKQFDSAATAEAESLHAEDLAAIDAHIMSTLTTAAASPPSASEPTQYSVYESYVYHVVDSHTRGNMQALLCASGASGWGGSLFEEGTRFRGRGQPLPPRFQPGFATIPCQPEDLLWNRFKRAGYVTTYALNECSDMPADAFGNGGVQAEHAADYELIAPFCHPDYDNRGEWSNFDGPYSMRRRCIAGRYVHEYSFDYARQYVRRHDAAGVPWFLFLSFIEAHEGSLAILALIDVALASFLRFVMYETSHPPVIVIASDHGSHMGPFMEFTRAGAIEHKLPALFTVVPERWLHHWDVRVKLDNLRSTTAATTAAAADAPFYTLHTDARSPSPWSVYPPSRASELTSSIGLSLHENQHSLVTAREIYWFLRRIPARTTKDDHAVQERAKETKWKATQEQQAHAAAPSSSPAHQLHELVPLGLDTPVPIHRRCDQAGVKDDLCVCGRFEH